MRLSGCFGPSFGPSDARVEIPDHAAMAAINAIAIMRRVCVITIPVPLYRLAVLQSVPYPARGTGSRQTRHRRQTIRALAGRADYGGGRAPRATKFVGGLERPMQEKACRP